MRLPKVPRFRPESGETVLQRWHPTLAYFWPLPAAGMLCLVLALVVGLSLLGRWALLFIALAVAFCTLSIALARYLVGCYTFILTDRRIREEFRLWVVDVREAPLGRVTNVTVFQDFVGRVLNFGSVRVDTAGTPFPGVLFRGVRDPLRVQKIIQGVVMKHAK